MDGQARQQCMDWSGEGARSLPEAAEVVPAKLPPPRDAARGSLAGPASPPAAAP